MTLMAAAARRVLLVGFVLAGLLAMHGLTANHSGSMPTSGMHVMVLQHASNVGAGTFDHDTDAAMPEQHVALASSHVGAGIRSTVEMGGMGGGCSAILVVSLLVALLRALDGRSSLIGAAGVFGQQRLARPVDARVGAAARSPSLAQLCVLRT